MKSGSSTSTRHCLSRLTLLTLSLCMAASAERRGGPPNIIVVMTDDQGYGEFSCHGNPLAQTPHIDRLASEALRLTDFHVSPMCTPTRGQLLTGLDAFRNGAINVSSGRTLLRPELKTMADVFKAAGYRTGMFGKWHLGDNYPFRPQDRGFNEAIWFPSSHINSTPDFWDNDYFDDTYFHNGHRKQYQGYCTDVFFGEAMRWMDQATDTDSPFFAYIALNAAHWPWFVPDQYRKPLRRALAEHPDVVQHLNQSQRQSLVSFLAMGANIDDNMGRLDRFLGSAGLQDNTIVVFLTDNGSTLGADYFNAGMRGKKTTLWEGGHRVPCFIRWPDGRLGPPRDIDELCHVQDLLPTLADLAAIPSAPGHLNGQSLAPVFRGERSTLGDRMLVINYSRMPQFKVTYTQGNPAIPQRDGAAVLWKHWRFLENRRLYDTSSDPHQDRDIAAAHPDVVAAMRAHLDNWWAGVEDRVLEHQRVILGSTAENPTQLSACEWLDVFIDQQAQVRRGDRKNGKWHLTVARGGVYRFELRRYPVESGLRLSDPATQTRVTDGTYISGPAFDIARARLRIGVRSWEKPVPASAASIQFTQRLNPGPMTMQTWFLDAANQELCGAYYVTVTRQE